MDLSIMDMDFLYNIVHHEDIEALRYYLNVKPVNLMPHKII